ncbi:MAG TPA: DUF790 family protein [Chloroflexia bacterium]|nr:DUF790 family protein [Chloroflexia bacterium]
MLFSLTNVKRRSVRDADGELAVVPKLLHGRSSLKLVEQAIATFEQCVGRPRAEYDSRALEAVMGDYRLGRCIEACLLTRYGFVQPDIADILPPGEVAALKSLGLDSPGALRLALWDAANERGGFVAPEEREAFLNRLAAEWGLCEPARIDALVSLDTESAAVLAPTADKPTAAEMLTLYNRGMVKTLLAHSTQVRFNMGSLPGDVLRRLYFIAKRSGVLVDVESDRAGGFSLTLFGPEQAFGSADKYGRRLADVSLSLLRSLLTLPPSTPVQGTASLVLHDRTYRFHLTQDILDHLEYAPEPQAGARTGRVAERSAAYSVGSSLDHEGDDAIEDLEPTFDSLVEASLYRGFRSLEKQGDTHGWLILREPDPLLAPGVVLIPDFAFERGGTRVYMEVAGFWSPSYKERKVAKLHALGASGEDTALILAVPKDSAPAFTGLPFPIVPYKKDIRATDMLALLDAQYGAREERLTSARGRFAPLQQAALKRGLVPERDLAEALQAYSRSELLAVAPELDTPGCRYVPGVGLLSDAAADRAHTSLLAALEASPERRIDLDQAVELVSSALGASHVDVEALLQLWPQFRVDRPSLFEAFIALA